MTIQSLTPALIRSIAMDAANRNMRKCGRTQWNEEDWDIACEMNDRLSNNLTA